MNATSPIITNSEKKGLVILIIHMLIWTIAPAIFMKEKSSIQMTSVSSQIENSTSFNSRYNNKSQDVKMNRADTPTHFNMYKFNPNHLNEEMAKDFQIPKKTYHNINKYLLKGGHFRTKTDLLKIYGLSNEIYSRLEPFMEIPPVVHRQSFNDWNEQPSDKRINLNEVNAWGLIRGTGMDTVLAFRIIKYRNSLGGFVKLEQLKEVFGVNDSLYSVLSQKLLPEGKIRRINLNASTFSELSKHPYIKSSRAKLIISYLSQHRNCENFDFLKSSYRKDTHHYRLLPYYLEIRSDSLVPQ